LFSFNQFCSHGALFNIIITFFFSLFNETISLSLSQLSPSEVNGGWLAMVMASNGAPTLGRSALYRSHSLSLSQLSPSEVNGGWLAMVMASNGAPTLGRSTLYRSHSLSLPA
jgi:hypothetical protein